MICQQQILIQCDSLKSVHFLLKLVFDRLEYRYKLKRWEVSPKTKKFDTPPAFFFFKKKAKKIPFRGFGF